MFHPIRNGTLTLTLVRNAALRKNWHQPVRYSIPSLSAGVSFSSSGRFDTGERKEDFSVVAALLADRLLSGRKYTEQGTGGGEGGKCTHRYQQCNLRVIPRVV